MARNSTGNRLPRALAHSTLYSQISESAFLAHLISLLRWHGYIVHHCRPAINRSGRYSTPIQGDAGMPDILALGHNRALLIELKSAKGKATPAQEEWLKRARSAGMEAYIFRPSDIDQIESILK